jgi:methyl-accepting chemotaxis protein
MNNLGASSNVNRSRLYALCGFLLGILAPIGWIVLRLVLFWQPGETVWAQISGDILHSSESLTLYGYMGLGTAPVLGVFGFLIGKASQQIHERARGLDELNQAVERQKTEFERRFRDLNTSIKNFHSINNHVQKSMDIQEVLRLSADGLHEILGYDRVNILMVNPGRESLQFVASRGTGDDDVSNIVIPLDERAGALYKTVTENRLLLVDDITRMPEEFHLKPPCDNIHQLRSRSFILCPIVVRDEVMGMFGVDNKVRHHALDETDVDTVHLFADQVSSALTRIDLVEAVDTLTRELDVTFRELLKYRGEHTRLDHTLKQATASTSEATADIARAADVVCDAVDATRSASGEISVSIEQVYQSLNKLTGFMNNSVSAMTEISATIRAVEENGTHSHLMSEKVKQQAETGAEAVSDVLTGLKEIAGAVESAASTIGRLSKKGEEINGITTVIAEITQKTNLLALNAAIIAAQAGEHGRSFAVVADEVRSLSVEAANSTGAIGRLVGEIQEYTRETVDHFARTRQLVKEGTDLGEGMETSLRQILESAVSAMEMARDIRKATQEVARSVESVTLSIDELGDMVTQISTASKEEAVGIRSIVKSIEEVKSMTDDMVTATTRQRQNTQSIETAVQSVSDMVGQIFTAMEERNQGSREVIESLELLKNVGGKQG